MLTVAEEDRFVDVAPTGPFTVVAADGSSQTYEPDFFWRGNDYDPDYPFIAFGWEGRGDVRTVREPLNNIAEIQALVDSDQVSYTKESPQTDTLSVQIAGVSEYDTNDVSPQTRVGQIGRQMWEWVTGPGHDALNSLGPNGERPCLIGPSDSPTTTRLDDTYRMQFSIEIQHTMTWTELEDAVSETETETTVE